jgi:outer membrane protein assembly factor BamB
MPSVRLVRACLVLVFVLAACSAPAPSPTPSAAAQADEPTPLPSVAAPTPDPTASPSPTPTPAPAGPLPGNLLIADRGNGRLLIVSPAGKVLWSLTLNRQAGWSGPPLAADDAFFTADGTQISINAEDMNVIARVDIASRRIVWSYGHDGVAGSRAGYLHTPDDAYPLPNGDTLVADIRNERILEISPHGSIVRQYGTTGLHRHNPPTSYASPNGDTPLPDGGLLVTEIGGAWVDRLSASGALVWSVHLRGFYYPSDAQLLPDGNILVVDYHSPGAVAVFTPRGSLVWSYRVLSGSGRLEHPSLAVRLPNGNYAVTDDDNNRVVIIDPTTNRIVWQYGHRGVPGTRAGYLNGPDGLDFAGPSVVLPS